MLLCSSTQAVFELENTYMTETLLIIAYIGFDLISTHKNTFQTFVFGPSKSCRSVTVSRHLSHNTRIPILIEPCVRIVYAVHYYAVQIPMLCGPMLICMPRLRR